MTDDFTKKLQEWEEKKVKRSSGTSFKGMLSIAYVKVNYCWFKSCIQIRCLTLETAIFYVELEVEPILHSLLRSPEPTNGPITFGLIGVPWALQSLSKLILTVLDRVV